jgi:hypothetical protein
MIWKGRGGKRREEGKLKIAMRHHRKISFFVNCLIAAKKNYVCLSSQWLLSLSLPTKEDSRLNTTVSLSAIHLTDDWKSFEFGFFLFDALSK